MPDLKLELTGEMIPALVAALESYCDGGAECEAVLFSALYDRRSTLIDYAADLSSLRDIERASLGRNLTEAEDAILHKLRRSACHWIHNKAGQILCDIANNPLADQVAAHDGEPDTRPGQDAGEALVGVECWIWDEMNGISGIQGPAKVDKYDPHGIPRKFAYLVLDQKVNGAYFAHARPVYLGRPTP